MKKIILTAVLASLLFSCKIPDKNEYNKDEIIFVVEMESNNDKSDNDIAEFSKYYTAAIDNSEPNSLGWGFFKSNDKIILIERYMNGTASDELKEYVKPFGLPFYFHPDLAKFSRN